MGDGHRGDSAVKPPPCSFNHNTTMKLHQLLILPVALTAFVACTPIKVESDTSTHIKQGVPGGTIVQTNKISATVTGIDAAHRKLTLVTPDGKKSKVKAGPEVVNFPQIRIGDQLNITATEQLVVRMAKPGEKTDDHASGSVNLAPVGAKPGIMTAETYQTAATVTAIDAKTRVATLQFADGTLKKFAVRKDVDLSQRKVGEKVLILATESFAIRVEKP